MDNFVSVEPVFLMYAFRYALGRMTYAVGDVTSALLEHSDKLQQDWKEQIVRDIEEAVKYDRAGHQSDIEKWQQLREHFVQDLTRV